MSETEKPAETGEDLRGAEKKEAFHLAAEALIHNFAFTRPDIEFPKQKKKIHVKLAGTNSVRASIQILKEGGENNLHYHPHMDLIYMVLKGRIRFYGPGDKVLGEFGPTDEAHLLQIAGFPKGVGAFKRIPIDPPKHADGGEGVWFDTASGKTLTDAEQQAMERQNNPG